MFNTKFSQGNLITPNYLHQLIIVLLQCLLILPLYSACNARQCVFSLEHTHLSITSNRRINYIYARWCAFPIFCTIHLIHHFMSKFFMTFRNGQVNTQCLCSCVVLECIVRRALALVHQLAHWASKNSSVLTQLHCLVAWKLN